MLYLFDTSILLAYLRKNAVFEYVESRYAPFTLPNQTVISVVTAGEILSLAVQNQWGETKKESIYKALSEMTMIDIHSLDIQERYAEIDAYSQNRLLHKPLPPPLTARNMGKNDLWIASCASVIQANLVTTDQDFTHLHNIYLNVVEIPIK